MNKYFGKGLLVLGSYIFVVVMIGVSLTAPVTMADNFGVDKFNLILPVSCTIGGESSFIHTQSVVNNQYYPSLGGAPTTFTMYCNDPDGFIVYAIGASNDMEGNTNLIGSTGSNISTGVYNSEDIDTTVSSWSFKLGNTDGTVDISSGYNDNLFHIIPSIWTEVAKKESGVVNSATGSQITATYDAYISGTQAAGTYTGQVKYIMFHPSGATTPITLAEAFENAKKTKIYTEDPLTGESGYFYAMQDMTSAICDATNVYGEASQVQLVDTRDGKLYWATKLYTDRYNDSIGQCWMTENLDLDLETTPTKVTALTSENTNLTLYGSKGYDTNNGYSCSNTATTTNCTADGEVITWTPERATATVLNDIGNDIYNPYSYDRGLSEPNDSMNGHGYSGNSYNWSAVVASNNSSSYNASNVNTRIADNSICPKGWRLPNAEAMDGGYEFSKLLYAYDITTDDKNTDGYTGSASDGLNKITSSPLYFVRSGFILSHTLFTGGEAGWYWSSAVFSANGASNLRFTNNNVYPAGGERMPLLSARCLAE